MADTAPMRERILNAALGLLRGGGLKKFGQTQIAKAAGIPQGHLTYYFPRKADLVLAVARRSLEIIAAVLETLPGGLCDDAASRARLLPIVESVVRDHARTRMLLGLLVEADDSPEVRALLVGHANAVRRVLATALGLDPDSPEAAAAVALLWGLGVNEFVYRGEATQETGKLLEALNTLLDLVPRRPR